MAGSAPGYGPLVPRPVASALAERLESISLLDAPARAIGKAVRGAVPPGKAKDALSGVSLGHPLHPLLTDIPIGTWTSAVLLDLIGGRDSAKAAERLIAAGLAATPATIATGWSDWADAEPGNDGVRRSGIVHAALNAVATGLFAASLAARRRDELGRGRMLSLAGISLVGASGWIGGHLAYAQGVGVDNTVFDTGAADWTRAMADADLVEGRASCARVDGDSVLLVRQGGRIHALADRCVHRGGALHEGELADGTITCPLHGSCFSLEDGSVMRGPATYPQPVFETRVRDGAVEVRRT